MGGGNRAGGRESSDSKVSPLPPPSLQLFQGHRLDVPTYVGGRGEEEGRAPPPGGYVNRLGYHLNPPYATTVLLSRNAERMPPTEETRAQKKKKKICVLLLLSGTIGAITRRFNEVERREFESRFFFFLFPSDNITYEVHVA